MPRKLNLVDVRYYFSWLKSFGDGDWETSEVGDFVTRINAWPSLSKILQPFKPD